SKSKPKQGEHKCDGPARAAVMIAGPEQDDGSEQASRSRAESQQENMIFVAELARGLSIGTRPGVGVFALGMRIVNCFQFHISADGDTARFGSTPELRLPG